ncbi:MAG TPA: tetratricopeptide repeat protein [Candidatus Melainabacteria bacterium]|nr:tetratricopeptide repeat protein [Candidatus Melainabacteria bacterium]
MQKFSKINLCLALSLLVAGSGAVLEVQAKAAKKAKKTEIHFNPSPFVGTFSLPQSEPGAGDAVKNDEEVGEESESELKKESKSGEKGKDKDKDEEEEPDAEDLDKLDEFEKRFKDPNVDNLKVKDPEVYLKRANIFVKHNLYKKALEEVNTSLRLNPSCWDARYLGAFIYQMQGRDDEAIQRYRHLLEVKPDNLKAHINLGTLLRKKGLLDKAEHHYREAIKINFYSLNAHYNLANVLIDKHRLEDALKELKACLKIQPNNAWVHNNLGVLYQKRNYLVEAEEEFLRAITLEPGNQSFEKNLQLLRSNQETQQARADLADLL